MRLQTIKLWKIGLPSLALTMNIELIEIVDVIREQEVYIKLGDVEDFIKNSLLGF